MIYATGIDIIEISRIISAIEKQGEPFLMRVFTPDERAYCKNKKHPEKHLAARFAVKEAVYKALRLKRGTALNWQEIEVCLDEQNLPCVKLSGSMFEHQQQKNITTIQISLSHSDEYACAVAIAETAD